MITDYHSKLFAHELLRRHSVADIEKMAGTLFDAQVDLNPHQVEAALFAFKSPLSKGAILADEVGLGKTIEAGLVLSQKWTEGKQRILIVGPASLRKQWAQEIEEKFFLPTFIIESRNYNKMVKDGVARPFEQAAIVICSFQFAARHADELMVTPWDLVVIDEAHRLRNVYRPDNKVGRALKTAFANVPKILLTATPLQNSLMELYGLVSIIDDYTFGDAKSFRAQYARLSSDGQFDELKARLEPVCHRTLRRQVLEYIRYTNRIPITQEFIPSEHEQQLYDHVSDYLCRPTLAALPSSQRTLMTLILRKLLASSTYAIAGALNSLANKLERQLKDDADLKNNLDEAEVDDIAEDYDGFAETAEEWVDDEETPDLLTEDDILAIESEIEELRRFKDLAVSITENAKGMSLLTALTAGFAQAEELGAAQKAIIFTESRRTQDYLVSLLSDNGYAGDLVLFNGSNADPQSKAIYQQWKAEHAGTDKVTGSRTADMRAALVEHFRHKAKIMIATEAAAEGINLQFCSMVVNYDLPWNPQRIEQRIGRCHRYGQKHDVVVVNFLNRNNAADQRVFELLSEKFQLFNGVFGASDEVLGVIESGVDFERRISGIYQTCRTEEQIEAAFENLRAEMDEQIAETMDNTRQKLLEHFDAEVHDRLKINMEQASAYLDRYATLLWALTKHELGKRAQFDDGHHTFTLKEVIGGVDAPVGGYFLRKEGLEGHRYRLGHPLAKHVLETAASRPLNGASLTLDYSNWPAKAAALEPFVGTTGTAVVHKLSIRGADDQDHVIIAAQTEGGHALGENAARRLFDLPVTKQAAELVAASDHADAHIQSSRQAILEELATRQAQWFDDEMEKLDNWAEDKRAGLKADLKDYDDQIKALKKDIRLAGGLPEKLALQRKVRELETRRDEAWRAYDEAAKDIETQKDGLLDTVEDRLHQDISDETLFAVRFEIV
ncbi:SNF2-related protein [uncultured Erythrobacter sp.]|uniref:SNF2-related protein n=1 Tax=uncultured Erythrobacter sp. TaxID=263913 RepID=UPI00261C850D|nr:SNF2-related protein [uncultured Erythrobacter sp.]